MGKLVIFDPSNKNSMSIDVPNAEGAHKQGNIGQLKLIDPDGIEHEIKKIPDGTIIETHHNPNCTWIFFWGQWWYICDE